MKQSTVEFFLNLGPRGSYNFYFFHIQNSQNFPWGEGGQENYDPLFGAWIFDGFPERIFQGRKHLNTLQIHKLTDSQTH